MTLTADDFKCFYRDVHGRDPFPWQVDIVQRALAEQRWPDVIDVPTGLGKTSMLDVAVFVLAATSGELAASRLGRRRVFFVVDRRIVVDEAHEHSLKISSRLQKAVDETETSVVGQVALGLRALAPNANEPLADRRAGHLAPGPTRPVLTVTRMRGGVTWDADWLDRPDLPGIVVGTVDQVGSRLLFRGYGTSDRRKPIDAALTGTDSLILVDEAHLAVPMIDTIRASQDREANTLGLPSTHVVRLSATAGSSDALDRRYSIDIHANLQDAVAKQRLTAEKRLAVALVTPKDIAQKMADYAEALLTDDGPTVLVVCNTIDRARQVHACLEKATVRRADPLDAELALLIGRSRPADRELLVHRLLQRFGVGRDRRNPARPAVLVATQTVEVGANLDADSLVTESAPWDSIVQRLGRVNRLGECPGQPQVVVVHDGVDDGPVYGAARDVTWTWLTMLVAAEGGELGVSPLECRELTKTLPSQALAPIPQSPIVTGPILDAWARTGPVPVPDAPVAPYLHGLGSTSATVSIAWRDGLITDDPMSDETEVPDELADVALQSLPIRTEEQVEVPLHVMRRWLNGESVSTLTDLDDDPEQAARVRAVRSPFRVLAWRPDDTTDTARDRQPKPPTHSWAWVYGDAVRPGDVLVVPSERGGLDEYGWAPDSQRKVLDVAEVVRIPQTDRAAKRRSTTPVLRLDTGTGARLGLSGADKSDLDAVIRQLGHAPDSEHEPATAQAARAQLTLAIRHLRDTLTSQPTDERLQHTAWTPLGLAGLLEHLSRQVSVAPVAVDNPQDAAPVRASHFLMTFADVQSAERDDDSTEGSSRSFSQIPLDQHLENVGHRARGIAAGLGLATELQEAIDIAARWHDLGKVEPRFQAMLCGGDEYAALLLGGPLAKSGMDPTDHDAYLRARRRSGLPRGARHEAWSASLVKAHLAEHGDQYDVDHDLVIHLVASHHGHSRPWLPAIVDLSPRDVTAKVSPTNEAAARPVTVSSTHMVDFDQPRRFAALNEKYGRWGLALLETIVRSADMTVSEEGS